jgi:cell division septal protein FtsQ
VYILYTFCLQYFVLKTIVVIGDGIQIAIDQTKLEKNLLFIRTDGMKKELLSNNDQIENVMITKKYPNTLVLSILLRTPFARVSTKTKTVIIDSRGVVLGYARQNTNSLPLMAYELDDVMDGTLLKNPVVQSGIAIFRDVSPVIPLSSLYISDVSSIRAIYGKTSIFFPLKTDYSALASTLQTLTARFRMKESMPTSIDLRFDKPVIRM